MNRLAWSMDAVIFRVVEVAHVREAKAAAAAAEERGRGRVAAAPDSDLPDSDLPGDKSAGA